MSTPFRTGPVAVLVLLVATSFLLTLVFAMAGMGSEPGYSGRADTFSRSALGHHAFAELLRRLDVPVVVNRRVGGSPGMGLLVLAEPDALPGDSAWREVERLLEQAGNALVVLPKWRAVDTRVRDGFVEQVREVPSSVPDGLLEALGLEARVQRRRGTAELVSRAGDEPGTQVRLNDPQLLRLTNARGLEVLCSGPDGALAVAWPRRDGAQTIVLADPDVLANHGLGEPGHAAFAMELIDRLRQPGQAVAFDETVHGHSAAGDLWGELLRFPLVLVPAHALLLAMLLVWASLGRFGAPRDEPPGSASGQELLIGNAALLLAVSRHERESLARYEALQEQRAAEELGLPMVVAIDGASAEDPGASGPWRGGGLLARAREAHQRRRNTVHAAR